jgi:hypothetical protein
MMNKRVQQLREDLTKELKDIGLPHYEGKVDELVKDLIKPSDNAWGVEIVRRFHIALTYLKAGVELALSADWKEPSVTPMKSQRVLCVYELHTGRSDVRVGQFDKESVQSNHNGWILDDDIEMNGKRKILYWKAITLPAIGET